MDEPKHTKERGEAFYLEFIESMKSRLEGGYLLPRQMGTVAEYAEAILQMEKHKVLCFSTLSAQVEEPEIFKTFLWRHVLYNLIIIVLNSC